jgi:hypothetical protein
MTTENSAWTFVAVDPLAPKKRRRRRKPAPDSAPATKRPRRGDDPEACGPDVTPESHDSPWTAFIRLIDDAASEPGGQGRVTACSPAGPSVFPGRLDGTAIDSPELTPSDRVADDITSVAEVTDFDRFFLLSDQRGVSASTIWTKVFGSHWNAPWTPLAKSGIESALLDFCESNFLQ